MLMKPELREVAEKYSIRYYTTKIEDLVSMDEVDAVSICTSNNMHMVAAVAAANAGKHILCEKPMAMNVSQAGSYVESCKRKQYYFS